MSAAPTGKGRSVTDRPYINPAEIELIAILLNRQNQLRDCEMLGRDDFQEARHYDAFTTIKDLHAAGESIDPLAVATAMDPKDKAEYSYLNAIAKEHGYFTGNLWARAVSMRKDAINRACQMAAANGDWTRIVELRAEYDRLGQRRFNTFTAAQLLAKEFPPLRWLVDGVLPEGCTLLAAPPKVGKSRLALQMALALANGGYALNSETTQCQAIEALYLALESGERRLQKDIRQLQPDGTIPVGLHLATAWRRLAEGGIGDLDTFLEREPGVKLIIIDTLAQARSATHGDNGFLYSSDYLTGAAIKELGDRHGISILIVHHTRKAISDDPLDSVSGSYGVTGSVDTVLVLERKRMESDGTLSIISRDYPDNRWALSFKDGLWTLRGTPSEASADGWNGEGDSHERRAILDILRVQPMRPVELAGVLRKNPSTLRTLLQRLAETNKIYRKFDGTYAVIPDDLKKLN